jgi:NADPH-dependent 7-cyano-7-deazaguanine reductase QueF-like protein
MGSEFDIARERLIIASNDFVDTLEELRKVTSEVADKLPADERNLKSSKAFNLFINESINQELAEEAEMMSKIDGTKTK